MMRRDHPLIPEVFAIVTLFGAAISFASRSTSQPSPSLESLNVRYGDAAGNSNLLDIYRPADAHGPLPLLVWVHGGGWAVGDKAPCPAIEMVSRGYVVASINYRLTKVAVYPAQIRDCKAAIRFLRAHAAEYHINAAKIGVWGTSAGGHLAALLGTSGDSKEIEGAVGGNLDQSSAVQAVCDWFGPTDLSQFADEAQASGMVKMSVGPPLIMALLGGPMAMHKGLARLANPISFITPDRARQIPPFLIMHGDKDTMVPIAQSRLLADALKTAGVPVEFKTVAGGGHGTGFDKPWIGVKVMSFFDKNLR